MRVVSAVKRGEAAVAAAFGVNQRSMYRWSSAFAKGGQNALTAKPVPGQVIAVDGKTLRPARSGTA